MSKIGVEYAISPRKHRKLAISRHMNGVAGIADIKLGGVLRDQAYLQSDAELRQWFHGDGSQVETDALEVEMRRILPDLRTLSVQSKTCVVTDRVDENVPLITPIVDGKVMVAAGGCGVSAKSSNEIGRLAALQLQWM